MTFLSAHPLVDHSYSLLILYFLFMPPKRVLTEYKPMLSAQARNGNESLLQRADTFTVLITLVLEAAEPEHPQKQAEQG